MTHTTHIISLYILNIIYYNERRTNVKKYLHFILYILLSFLALYIFRHIPLCTSLVLYKSPFIHGITKKVTANNAVVDGIKIERRLARSFAANAILGCGGNLR